MTEPGNTTNLSWTGDGGRLPSARPGAPDYDPGQVAARSLDGAWAAPARRPSARKLARAQAEREAWALAMFRALKANSADEGGARRRDLLGPAMDHLKRRSRAYLEHAEATSPTVRCHLTPGNIPLDVAFDQPPDPREADPSFRQATEEEQLRIRAAWAAEAERDVDRARRRRRRGRVAVREATLLFAFLGAFFTVFVWPGLWLPMIACGPVAGLLWHHTNADRLGHALIGVLGFVASAAVAGAIGPYPGLLFAVMLTAVACSIRGLRCEYRQLEGSD